MSLTRHPAMTQEQADKLHAQLRDISNRGASVTLQDSRVTAVQNWIFATLGGSMLLVCAWVGNSIQELNVNVAKLSSQAQYKERVDEAQDARLSIYDDRLRNVEREVYSGGGGRGRASK